jgi:hypothetical protein
LTYLSLNGGSGRRARDPVVIDRACGSFSNGPVGQDDRYWRVAVEHLHVNGRQVGLAPVRGDQRQQLDGPARRAKLSQRPVDKASVQRTHNLRVALGCRHEGTVMQDQGRRPLRLRPCHNAVEGRGEPQGIHLRNEPLGDLILVDLLEWCRGVGEVPAPGEPHRT